jgi:hypothetical protein
VVLVVEPMVQQVHQVVLVAVVVLIVLQVVLETHQALRQVKATTVELLVLKMQVAVAVVLLRLAATELILRLKEVTAEMEQHHQLLAHQLHALAVAVAVVTLLV